MSYHMSITLALSLTLFNWIRLLNHTSPQTVGTAAKALRQVRTLDPMRMRRRSAGYHPLHPLILLLSF
jgi:hypothetical protein